MTAHTPSRHPPNTDPGAYLRKVVSVFAGFLLVMGLLAGIMLGAFAYFGAQQAAQTERFRQSGIDMPAEVVRAWKDTGSASGSGRNRRSGATHYLATVRFAADGAMREAEAALNSASLWQGLKSGQSITIRYLKDAPDFVLVKGDDPDESMDLEGWLFLGGATVVLLLLSALAFWARRFIAPTLGTYRRGQRGDDSHGSMNTTSDSSVDSSLD
ncbi:MAG: DUF3592 domain-containing protein [Betaproteobacteria bacterium]|nr:DUF3592 domain-containing protein [Betaproteobacteria bacterium]